MLIISISDNEPIESLGISILIADKVISSTVLHGPSLDLEQRLQVLEERHLLRVVLGVVLDVLLVSLQVLHDRLLLSQLGVEELRVRLELVRQTLLRLVDELGLVPNSLQEGIVDLSLDVVVMVLALVVPVVIEGSLHLRVHLPFLLVQVHHDVVVLLLLFRMDSLDFLHLGS